MGRIFLLVFIIYALLIIGLLTQAGQILAFMILFMVYLLAGVVFSPDDIKLRISRKISASRVLQGASVTIHLNISNEGPSLEEVFLEETELISHELIDGATSLMTTLKSGEKLIWEYTLRAERGFCLFSGINVTAGDHLGLVNRSMQCRATGSYMALPFARKLRRLAIRPRQTKIYSGFIPARSGGQGIEFFGVREHQQGDPPRLINWKATARHQRSLFTNEFEQERVADVGLILDARERCYKGSNQKSLFESAVSATATLADACLNDGNRVGLFIFGRTLNWTHPGYGKIQKERIMMSLAEAKVGTHQVFDKLENLPLLFFPALSQLIFISPLQKDDLTTLFLLRSRGYQVLVVSPSVLSLETMIKDDQDFETGWRLANLERTLMLKRLRQVNVSVLDWQVHVPLNQMIDSQLNRRQVWKA